MTDEATLPTDNPVFDPDRISDNDSGDDWEEVHDDVQDIICLFCDKNHANFPAALKHLETVHKFILTLFKKKHSLDTYLYIKLVNFIRANKTTPEELDSLHPQVWDSDEYLMPVLQDDSWLMLDIEDFNEDRDVQNQTAYPVNSENGCVTLSEVHFVELQRTIQSLKAQLEQRDAACQLAKEQIDDMKEKVQRLVLDDESLKNTPSDWCDENKSLDCDEGYFNTYSHFAIHHEMLTDKVRTESYRDALLTNSNMFNNCVMLDVGCGTGILSMFAAKSGCRQVISVDQSDIIYHAMDIVRENNLADVITLKKGRLEDIDLPVDKVDAIVSEWMGYFLLFEGMLDTIIFARDNYLVPGGKLLPNLCNISIVGSGDTNRYIDLVDYWSNVYGFKMSCMKPEVVREPSIEVSHVQDLITNACELQSFDLYKVTTECVNFTSPFDLKFSTSPHAPPTHWKQTVFSLSEPIGVTEGETITGRLTCRRHVKDVRGLAVTIQIKNFSQVYFLN
ncbi:protein arginine N-methyltransferase 3 isoform X2 [Athalia rosae]|uniref:protein arginine N-methyltransferase 3 isoform X2 n=1 Tax=Athalia rosae TaxID=37344 RepID=UPI002033886E|nr:protein arginine N-methyltransferase 3 isoform X2 [Athalia rosae]